LGGKSGGRIGALPPEVGFYPVISMIVGSFVADFSPVENFAF
jgi:hypothetical protein